MKKNNIFAVITTLIIAAIIGVSLISNRNTGDTQIQEEKSITIAMVTFPGYAPLYLAEEKGLFWDLDVELVRIESIGDMRAAMNSNKIDMYAATYDIFQAVEGNVPPGIWFLAIDESHGWDGVVVSEDINTLEDLKWKTVWAEPGLPPYFMLQYLLNEEWMNLDDINFVDLTSADAGSAFVSNQIDVAATYEPYLSISKNKREWAKVLVSSEATPGLLVDFLFASEDLANNNPEVLEAVSQGRFDALEYWENNPDESMTIMGDAFGVDKAEMEDIKSWIGWLTLEDNQRMLNKSQPNNAYDTFELVGDILERNNSAGIRVDSNEKITDKIINRFK